MPTPIADRARELGARPIEGRHYGWFFVILAGLVAVTAAAVLLANQQPARPHARPLPPPVAVALPSRTASQPAARQTIPLNARALRAATRAARRFAVGYLAFQYHHGSAAMIRSVTPAFRAALAAAPPRVPAAQRRLHPRIALMQVDEHVGASRVALLALVRDHVATYTLHITVTLVDGAWLATGVGT